MAGPDRDEGIAAVFEACVRACPDALAVMADDECLSYAELDRRADRLAQRLRARGVSPEVLVALCVGRTPHMLVGLIAIWKAGGAYLPLDASYPASWIRQILADSGAPLLLTESASAAAMSVHAGRVLCIDDDADPAAPWVESSAAPRARADNLAYCIYTSGTTGRPKGVAVGGRSLLAHARAMQRLLELRPGDRVLQMTPLIIDAALEEILPTLLAGATIVLPTLAMLPGPGFMRFLEDNEVSVVSLATSLWERWFDAEQAASWTRPSHLRLVFVGGERVPAEKLRRWQALPWTHGVHWIADYGPTEATISCTTWRADQPFAGDTVPIGRPVDGTTIHVLDAALEPVDEGEVGDIWIAGGAPARGYFAQPALTADAFRPDPRGEPGSRMYRSGDLGRQQPNGELLFLGRSDEQIKLSGHRIETSAIENSLLRCEGVRDATVALHRPAAGDAKLVAYLVGSAPDVARVRRQLAASLPAHMIPDDYIVLDELPRMRASGKLDRRRLPPPASSVAAPPALGDIEQLVMRRWAEVAGHAPDGGESDFFRAGGDSLRAMRLLTQLRADLGVELDFADLYRHPTALALASVLEGRQQANTGADVRPTQPTQLDTLGLFPASQGQQRLWFLDRFHDGAAAYSVPLAFRVRGAFPMARLDLALSAIVARHEALRTGLVMEGDRVMQMIVPPSAILTKEIHAASLDKAKAIAATEIARPFDFTDPPLLRSLCIAYAADERLWVLNVHHAVCDAWSLALIFDELRAELSGNPPSVPVPQYRDHVVRQQTWLSGPGAETQREFWRKALSGPVPRLNLDHRLAHGQGVSGRGAVEPLRIDPALVATLRAKAANRGTTPYVVALSAFAAVLHRWTMQDRIVIGVPSACRTTPDDEAIVGFFANTLAVPVEVDPGESLDQLIGRVAACLASAVAHHELPFDHAVDALGLSNRATANPLFQAMFVMQDAPVGQGFGVPGCVVEEVIVHNGTAKMDLCVMLRSVGDRFEGEMEYDLDVLAPAMARSLAQAFLTLLAAAVHAPGKRIDELPAVSAGEQAAQVAAINAAHAVYDAPDPSFALGASVLAHARLRPNAIAIEASDAVVSYADLDHRANRMAAALAAAGVGAECLVGICMDRSAAMIVALLGVLRAGAGFVPLSPRAPRNRLGAIIADAAIAHVVTQPKHADLLAGWRARLWLEEDLPDDFQTPTIAVHPDQIAYVYYTSGSTGTPKGVAIDHRCAANRLAWLHQRYPLHPGDRMLHKTPLIFDVAIWEIFGPLDTGATVVAADPDAEADAGHIADLLAMPRMVFGHFVPSMLDAWLRTAPGPHGPDLKWVQMSGEAPSARLIDRFREYSGVELHNCYGQTETSEVAAWEDAGEALAFRVPIGRQVGIYRLFVLDRNLEPVPPGMPGELCVAGVNGLARGYHGRPAWTAERFVPNPFAIVRGERLYRTGDLVRVNADGVLESLGRFDNQVKIRGCRVEIAEVERVLMRFREMHACAVVTTRDADGMDQLVAYAVGRDLSPQALGEHAERHLPDYMLPAVYVVLDALPFTASGKLDRLRLPPPAAEHFQARGGSESPESGLERELAELWIEVLKLPYVGRRDNFFAVGGNSLKAIQVLTRIRSGFGVQISVRAFFAEPTVAGLAGLVDAALVELVASMSEDETMRRLAEAAT